MSAVLLGHWEPGSPEWHAARKEGLGGSEIAPILGLSPFESRFSLWHRKAGVIGQVEESSIMEWGKRLEPAILGKFIDEHRDASGLAPAGTWRNEDRPYQLANPDFLDDRYLVEAKWAPYGDGWGADGTDEIPIYYRVQCIWYGDCLGRDEVHVAALIGAGDYREYLIRWDPAEAEQLRAAAVEFLATIEHRVQPDIDAHTATYSAIREMHPDIDGADVELDEDLARLYCGARCDLAAAKDAEQYARSLIADVMGNAKRARFDGRTIATRQVRGDGQPFVTAARNLPSFVEAAA